MSKRRPSPAMIVAVIALVLGLGGAAIAADLTKPQVKKIAKKVANQQIKKKASGLSVAKAANADNATNAASAANAGAVDGVSAAAINYRTATTDAETTILDLGGLRMVASCPAGTLTLVAETATNNSVLRGFGKDIANTPGIDNDARDEEFDVGDEENLVIDSSQDHVQFLEFSGGSGATGSNVSVQYTVQDDTHDCVVTGHALQSG